MGVPKGLLPVANGPLISRIIDRVGKLTDDVLCVTCEPEVYAWEAQRVRFVADYNGEPRSPLSGILGALSAARYEVCIVVGVDMPFLNPALLQYLASLAQPFPPAPAADVVLPTICGDRPECVHAVYRKSCLPAATAALEEGRVKVTSFFRDVQVTRVPAERLRRIDPLLSSFVNVNTPREHARILTPGAAAGHATRRNRSCPVEAPRS